MTSPMKPWETNKLQNSGHIMRSYNVAPPQAGGIRSVPLLPPRPPSLSSISSPYPSYQPYSSYGGPSYGYGSYDMPYRNSLYNSYSSYGMYGGAGYGSGYGSDDAERRFVQFAEESSRNTFANVESIVRAFSSLAMMLDNTFFAMTSSFRAVLSVAENFGRLRSMFGHIWHSINVFRLFGWLYKRLMQTLGFKMPEGSKSLAWNEAAGVSGASGGSGWPTLAFLGVLMSAPYFINKLLPKYEDKSNPENWKTPGVRAKGAFDFVATSPSELSIQTNDEVLLAPKHIQDEMKLTNTGWAFAVCNRKSGVVPLNYLVLAKKSSAPSPSRGDSVEIPVPKHAGLPLKSSLKKVTFGENQIFDVSRNAKDEKLENSATAGPSAPEEKSTSET